MKRINYKALLRQLFPHLVAVLTFLMVAILYCKPVLDNKVLFQEDVLQWQAMARNSFQYKETHGHFPLWSNGMFSGMPAYQIAMDPRSVSVPDLFYGLFTLFLQKPVSFFFLACCCFYFLSGVLRINPYIGIIGGLAYAYATYNPVIVSVGHDTKMQSIALLPGVIGSLILIAERKYWRGMALMILFTALMISFNHIQIVYYTLIIAAGLLLNYGIRWAREKDLRQFGRVILMTLGAGLVGILCNAVVLFTTYDSSKETIRGGSELADAQSNYTKTGLNLTAAFDFSMYKLEPFVLMVPDIYGGSTDLELPAARSKAVRAMAGLPPALSGQIGETPRYYWGGIGEFSAGPAYVGAVICLLALLGFFILDNRYKWWVLGVTVLTIMMSWGGYFRGFNELLLKYLPFYNKFRAPSMILVVPTFLLCLQAMLTLQKIMVRDDREVLWRQYRKGLLLVLGCFLVLGGLYLTFDYASTWEGSLLKKAAATGQEALDAMRVFVEGLRSDRKDLFLRSLLRSLSFVVGGALIIGLHIRYRLRPVWLLSVIGVLAFSDVISTDLRYLNNDNYQERKDYQQNFVASDADRMILADKGYYRVFDLRDSASNTLSYGAMTAYFHNSIGGYHAAKLKIYEDLINRQLFNFPNCQPVIDMLNTKYIIRPNARGKDSVYRNPSSLGPVWFVRAVRYEPTPQAVMNALTRFHPRDTAILFSADRGKVVYDPQPDTTKATIQLTKNDNDEISYLSQSPSARFAVFSEVYYKRGWRAWIDDHEAEIIRTNYVLRGLSVPPGRHIIRFLFRPLSYFLGRQVQWMASIIFLLILTGAVIVAWQDRRAVIRARHVSSPKKECEPLYSV